MDQYVASRSQAELADLRTRFQKAPAFPHIAIDNFLSDSFIESLESQFPSRNTPDYEKYCVADDGRIGSDYANCDPSSFPPAFGEFDALIRSDAFRDLITQITGIDGLEYDADYFGGGIRESNGKTQLLPHIDFNYHPKTLHHRRLNILLYLNRDWRKEWGGNLQIHRNPNEFADGNSLVTSYEPIWNRCLIFETSETSWHAFDRLCPPPGLSRRALTIYYYTKERPHQEGFRIHNTEYVELPLDARFRSGYQLTDADVAELKEGMVNRDRRIRMLYDIRAEHDSKYAHLWKEYEYYLARSREFEKKLASLDGNANQSAAE
ncbi:MAG: 2OG-Fe(II) oxygenase [Planctomycetota bacterium]